MEFDLIQFACSPSTDKPQAERPDDQRGEAIPDAGN